MAEFRSDLQSYVSLEIVEACITLGVRERPPERGTRYWAFGDPSGGSEDRFVICVGHLRYGKDTLTVDCVREMKPPFSPEQTTKEFAEVLRSYGISKVIGDRYAGEWPREQFGKYGIRYEASARPKSELYVDFLALLNSCRVELLDNPRLVAQLVGLERQVSRGGKDSINHAPGGHDDLANAVAGLASISLNKYGGYDSSYSAWQDSDVDDQRTAAEQYRMSRYAMYLSSHGMITP